jgi:hypothetical protein
LNADSPGSRKTLEEGIENPRVGGSIPSPATIERNSVVQEPAFAGFFAPARLGIADAAGGAPSAAPGVETKVRPGAGTTYAIIVAMRQPSAPPAPVLRVRRFVRNEECNPCQTMSC